MCDGYREGSRDSESNQVAPQRALDPDPTVVIPRRPKSRMCDDGVLELTLEQKRKGIGNSLLQLAIGIAFRGPAEKNAQICYLIWKVAPSTRPC
jgi:hypothetical protein